MDIHTATEQAYRNGYEAGLAENEESVCQLRKNWQDAEMQICTMCGHFDHKTDGDIVYGNKQCGEIVGFPFCGKFTPWIAVTERLPEKEGDYLIYTTVHFVPDHVDELDHYDAILISGYHPKHGFLGKGGKKAKAWMPLPNPPTE